MSEPFDRDEAWAENELRRACAELDGHIADGFLDDFSSRLAGQLEGDTMETSEPDQSGGPIVAPSTPDPHSDEAHDEHSGLHEIKALANSARERISRRRTSEHDLEDSLLASSSSALPAVVLPDPGKSTPGLAMLSASSSGLEIDSSASSSFRSGAGQRTAKPWLWLAAGAVGLAGVAALALLLLLSEDGDSVETVAMKESASTESTESTESALAPPPAAEPAASRAPSVTPLPLEDSEPMIAAKASKDGMVPAEPALEEESAAGAGAQANSPARKADLLAARRAEKKERDNRPRERASGGQERGVLGGVGKSGAESDDVLARENKKAKKKVSETAEGEGDIDAILDEVTGGPSKATAPEPEEEKPDQKRIGSSDVKKAMGSIRGKVNRCGTKTGFTGRVSMKFSVSPTGKVTKAKAKTSDKVVARCVEAAVRSARFPSFEPPSVSFSYPFLLTD